MAEERGKTSETDDLLIGGAGADNLLGDSSHVATSLTWSFTDSAGVRLFTPVVGEADPLGGAADEILWGLRGRLHPRGPGR